MKNNLLFLIPIGILVIFLDACGRNSNAENQPQAMTKDDIKAMIIARDVQPSAEALARKEKSNNLLDQKHVPILPSLPVIEDSLSAKIRSKEEIAHRAIALCIVAVKGEGLEQTTVQKLITRYDAQNYFTPAEKSSLRTLPQHSWIAPISAGDTKAIGFCFGLWVMLIPWITRIKSVTLRRL